MPIRGLRARGGWWRGDKPMSRLFPRHCVLWPDVQMCWQSQDDVILELGWGYWQHQLLLLLDCTDSQENQVLIKQREEELLSCGMLSEMALSISPLASVILGLHLFFPLHSSKMHEWSESPCCGKHLAKFCYCVCQQSVFCFLGFF